MGNVETYLKTQQVAKALGVSSSTIKRWVDAGVIEATRTMGKHRLVTLSSALRFARQEKFPVDHLLSIKTSPASFVVDDLVIDRLVEALRSGQAKEVRRIVGLTVSGNQGAVVAADQLIRPAMERVGNAWMVGSWDVYQEHQATLMVISAVMEQIRRLTPVDFESRPVAIGASPSGDPYVLPGLLGELVLIEAGWRVKNLGNNLPLRSLAKAIRDLRPGLVFVSASVIADRDSFLGDYSYFYEAASLAGSAIILGGRGFDLDLRSKLVYASFGERMAHLAEFARRLLPDAGANSGSASVPQVSTNSTT